MSTPSTTRAFFASAFSFRTPRPRKSKRLIATLTLLALVGNLIFGTLTAPLALAENANDVVINEYLVNPTNVADTNGEWIELYNTTGALIDLNNWTIDDGTTTHTLASVSIPAHGYIVLGNDGNFATNGGVAVDFVWGAAEFLDNAGSVTLTLKDDSANVIDATNVPANPTPGQALSRDDPTLATFHAEAVNKFNADDYGTPRSTNSPAQVSNVSATDGGVDVVTITWDAVTGADNYKIYRDGTLLNATNLLTLDDDIDGSLDLSSVTLSAVPDSTTQITVSWDAGAVDDSTTYTYTVVAERNGVAGATSAGDDGFVTPVITDYELFYVGAPDTSVGATGGVLTLAHAGLTANTSHAYKIRATSLDTSWSALSANSITSATLPATPPDPTVTASYDDALGYLVTVSTYAPGAGTFAKLEIDETTTNSGGSDRSTSSDTNDYVDTGLVGGTQYCYRVRAQNSLDVVGAWSGTVCDTTPPAIPGTLIGAPTAASTTSIDWSWTNVAVETGYNIYNALDALIFSTVTNDVSEPEAALTTNTAYTRYVRGENAAGEGEASALTTAYTAQSAPTSFTFTNVGTTSLTANANGVATNLTLGSSGLYFDNTTSATNSGWQQGLAWNSTSLTPNTTYSFTVKARNGDAIETASANDTQTTLAETPLAPTLTRVTTGGVNHSIAVALNLGNNPAATEFAIQNTNTNQYLQGDGTLAAGKVWKTKANWETGVVNYSSALSANTQYGFQLVARNADNIETVAGATSTIFTNANDPVGAPTVAVPTAEGTLVVSVNDTSGNGVTVEYALQETTTGNYVQSNGALGGAAYWTTKASWQTVSVTGLTSNTSYAFQAKARNSENAETAFTASASRVTLADAVTNIVIANATTANDYVLTLTWDNPVTLPTGHKIEIDAGADGSYETILYDDATTRAVSPFSITGRAANTAYRVRITSYNSESVANTVTIPTSDALTTPPAAPANLAEGAGSDETQVVWTWDVVTDATSYQVYDSTDALLDTVNAPATTWTHDGLTINSASTIYIRSVNANGEGMKTATTTRYTDSALPNNLSETLVGTTEIDWAWSVNGNPADTNFFADSTSANADSDWIADLVSYIDAALTSNTAYTLSVQSRNEDDEASNAVTLTKYTNVETPDTPTFGTITSTSIEVNSSVAQQADAEANFMNETDATESDYSGNNVFTWNNGSLTPNTQYTYSVQARNGDEVENPVPSASASKYTLANVPADPTVAVIDQEPTQLSVDVNIGLNNPAGTEYALAIDDDGDGVAWNTTNYITAGGAVGAVAWQTEAAWGVKTITGLTANTLYRFQVKARNGENVETTFSGEVALATLANPVNAVTATPGWSVTNNNYIILGYGLNGATNVRIRRVNDATDVYTGSATSFTDTNRTANTTYTYRIYSRNTEAAENSAYTEISATTPPAQVVNLTASASDSDSITWTWDATPGATGYKIYNASNNAELTDTAALTYDQNALSSNTLYSTYVRAYGANLVLGEPSATASGYTASTIPAGLAGVATSTTQIDWSWNLNGNPDDTEYDAEDSAVPVNTQAWSTNLTWSDTGATTALTPNTAYTLSVKSRNTGAPASESVPATLARYTAIETPTTITLDSRGTDNATLTADGAFSNLGVGASALIFNLNGVDQAPVTTTDTTLLGLTPDTSYDVKVKARNGDGVETIYGTTLTIMTFAEPPLAPTLGVGAPDYNSLTVDLVPSAGNPIATTYALAIDTDGDGVAWNTIQYVQADGTVDVTPAYQTEAVWGVITVTGLIPNTLYRVRGVSQNNNSDFGPTSTLTTAVSPFPDVVLSTLAPNPTNAVIPVTATFSEDVNNFIITDIVVGNGVASNFSATSASVYTFDITPSADGAVTIDVPAGVAQDTDTNDNTASVQLTRTYDSTAPSAVFLPANSATGIAVAVTPTITLDEAIRNLDDSAITDGNVANLLTFKLTNVGGADVPFTATIDGTKTLITLTPTAVLNDTQTYYLALASVEDALNNATNATSIIFTTVDLTAPIVTTLVPADDATLIAADTSLTLTFDEAVNVVNGKNIVIQKTSDDSVIETIAADDGAKVSGTGTNTITINPATTLENLTEYYVLIDAGAFQDLATNAYAGIVATTTWSFTTTGVCAPASVENGSVAVYPTCTITCNSGYRLSGNACIRRSSGGGGGGGGGSSSTPTTYTLPNTPSNTSATIFAPLDLSQTDGKISRPIVLKNQTSNVSVTLAKDTVITVNGKPFVGTLNPPNIVRADTLNLPTGTKLIDPYAITFGTGKEMFSPPMTVTIPFTDILKKALTANALQAIVYNPTTKRWETVKFENKDGALVLQLAFSTPIVFRIPDVIFEAQPPTSLPTKPTIPVTPVTPLVVPATKSFVVPNTISEFPRLETRLKIDDAGEGVALIQQLLKLLGFYSGEASGQFDVITSDAVYAFQRSLNIVPNRRFLGAGRVGKATLRELNKTISAYRDLQTINQIPNKVEEFQPLLTNLARGASGIKVAHLQQILKLLNFYFNPLTAVFDVVTENAVYAFQRSLDIVPNRAFFGAGIFGKATRRELNKIIKK